MAKSKNYYQILGIDEQATAEQIKKSYRSLARKFHPDRNPDRPDAEERFKAIQEAYDILSDPDKRKEYDRYRKDPFASFQTTNGDQFYRKPDGTYVRYERTGGQPQDIFGNGDNTGGFSSFINKIFGAEQETSRSQSGGSSHRSKLDIDTRLRLTFNQALQGGKTEVTLPHGETVRINIPRGVHSGFKIRLKGRGHISANAAGDLYVTFDVEPHTYYRRRGDDLNITCSINPIEAMLGVTRNVINAYGNTIKVKIPPGTQHGTKLRLRGQGVETASKKGDLYVKIEVHIPDNLSDAQLDILRTAAKKAKLI